MWGERQRGGATVRTLIFTAIGVAVAFFAAGQFSQWRNTKALEQRTNALEESVAATRAEVQAVLSAVIAPERLAIAQRSVYLIVVNGAPFGTAFVVDREKGILATAAHVADALPLEDENAKITLLNRTAGNPLTIQSVRLHKGFGVFREIVEDLSLIHI